MSYDLMVFRSEAAPKHMEEFMEWYNHQIQWSDNLDYNDPKNTSEDLQNFFQEIIKEFPAMNGPFASDNLDDPRLTDYSIGKDVIYASFAWSQAELANKKMIELATKYKIGFFDISGSGAIYFPDAFGILKPLNMETKRNKQWWRFL